jgi:para-nitrobenzyl esterase
MNTKSESMTLTRRSFVKSGVALIAAASAARASGQAATPAAAPAAAPAGAPAARSTFVTVETTSGKIRGLDVGGIKHFKGVPYGASTGGKNRFMPPQKPAPWADVRDCYGYGPISPQVPSNPVNDYSRLIQWDEQPGGMGEDCLVLNVYTPAVGDGKKRPVMVSFHGGGYAIGSNNAGGFYGDPLARYGDVVVVTPNHRLAVFGFAHFADLGAPAEFAQSGVGGMLDLVAALEWVRDNIANFGGDPNTVMIWGQSGGGAKTSTLMGMPGAKGLFHRAAVQSGSALRVQPRENATKLAEKLIEKLGIPKDRIADIQKLPWQQILDAQTAVAGPGLGGGFSPVLDGTAIPRHPFDPAAPEISADVPMIVSTTLEDAALSLANFNLDEAGLKGVIANRFPKDAERILPLYRKTYPTKSPYLVQAQILTDSGFRRSAIKQAELKSAQGKAPVWMYLWEWPTPAFNGKFGAVHGTDVGLAFHSTRGAMYGETPDAIKMADRLASAWVNFARSGDPNNKEIPHWAPYKADGRAVMVFDNNTRVENDYRGEFRKLWEEISPPSTLG